MKKFLTFLLTICISFTAFAGTGCRGAAGSNDPNTLEIYCYVQGFGTQWLEGVIDLFEETEWVKQKYPNLKVVLESDSISSQASNRLYNQRNNYTDLFFGSYKIDKIDPSYLTNLTETVYATEVPDNSKADGSGTGQIIYDLLPEAAHNALYELDEEVYPQMNIDGRTYESYYGLKYVNIWYGWMYNKDLFDAFKTARGWELPVTTEEFYAICEDILVNGYDVTVQKTDHHYTTPIMLSGINGGYAANGFPVYWVQYEGIEQYENFYNGQYVVDGQQPVYSEKVLEQKGRLRSLETIEEIWSKYTYDKASETDYLDAQTKFLMGQGLFHWNGDYFTSEMALTRKAARAAGTDFRIETFATPVLSQLVEKLSFYNESLRATPECDYESFKGAINQKTPYKELDQAKQTYYDTVLAGMIREVDAGKTFETATKSYHDGAVEITQKDWDIVYNARQVKGARTVPTQAAVIPESTPAKDLAVDFLRFMYTPEAIEEFSNASGGVSFPVKYYENLSDTDFEAKVAKLEPEAQTKFEWMFRKGAINLPANTQFSFGKVGLENLKGYRGNMNQTFISKASNRATAMSIFKQDVDYWKGEQFTILLEELGLA